MKEFKIKVKNRMIFLLIVVIALGVVLGYSLSNRDSLIDNNSHIFVRQVGFICGMLAVLLVKLSRSYTTLRDSRKLERAYIQENDERMKLIIRDTSTVTLTLILACLAMSMVFSSFYSSELAQGFWYSILISIIIMIITYLFFNKKY
ncbi:hypothetical protein LJB88_02230 [Erysipelotrichaceae bacterium OttesenSCG-928-M19]|nr:hypothetical protein [Erysipelotrichaceae bacterium OttesenSCG-928-M19]